MKSVGVMYVLTKFSDANGGREISISPCSADHEQDCQPFPVDPYAALVSCDHTCIHTYILTEFQNYPSASRQLRSKYIQ